MAKDDVGEMSRSQILMISYAVSTSRETSKCKFLETRIKFSYVRGKKEGTFRAKN